MLGHLVAQLPFRIQGRDIKLSRKQNSQALMENIDDDMEEDDSTHLQVTIVLCKAWIKVPFDDKGGPVTDKANRYVYSKAQVSCLT